MMGRRFVWLLLALSLAGLAGLGSAAPTGTMHGVSQSIPPVTCPTPPVNTTWGQINCVQTLDLTEMFVILIGLTIVFYVYKDADKAELPGEATEIAVTGEEELSFRARKEQEERARAELEGQHHP